MTPRAERLAALILDYSYPERRTPELVATIDELLGATLAAGEVALGRTSAEVREALGPPLQVLGDETSPGFDWHYPCRAPSPELAGDEWMLVLRFAAGRVATIETRIWREGR